MKRIVVLLLCFCLLLTTAVPAFAATPSARLFNVYADDMLFQRDVDAIFAGEAPSGSVVRAALFDQAGTLVTAGNSTAENGRFSVAFRAPAGSYNTYTVRMSCDGAIFATLKNVVFGELWLASGQSNMEYPLNMTAEGQAMMASNKTGPHDVHFLWVPAPQIDGVFQTRYLPQNDAVNCHWFPSNNPLVYNVSAPAYFFAVRLQQTLDMPVGILDVPLGGSAIASWLSREAIDGNTQVKQHLIDANGYYDETRWSSPDCSMHFDMTNLYNANIAPLLHFRPQGTIWYQGCTDLIFTHSADYYRDCFDLMQDSYTADFGYTRGRLPFIFTQLACYNYGKGPFSVTEFNEVFTDLAKADPASRGEVTIYDLSLAFNEMGAIHPMTKQPLGERMAFLAEGLVYGKKSPTSAPYCKTAVANGDSVFLTFENVGSGLKFTGGLSRGFAVCGKDGIAVEAQAEIVSSNTVRVFSPDVASPVAATYAAGSWSERANLWSTYNGKPFLPAAPVGIHDAAVKHHFADNAWMNCENATFFKSSADPGYIDTWSTSGCTVSLDSNDKTEGNGALRIAAQSPLFSLSPNLSEKDGIKTVVYDNVDANWSDYGTLHLQVKNCGSAPIRLNAVRLYADGLHFFTPICNETGLAGMTVPADGAWHRFTFDLNRLRIFGVAGAEKTNDILTQVKRIRFQWEGANAELLLDDIGVRPEEAGQSEQTLHLIDYLKAAFAALCDMLRAFFGLSTES